MTAKLKRGNSSNSKYDDDTSAVVMVVVVLVLPPQGPAEHDVSWNIHPND